MVIRVLLVLTVAFSAAVDAAETPAPDWRLALSPQPERPLLRLMVVERRADEWLVTNRVEVLAALRAGTVASSVAIYAAEVLLARADLTYDEALDLHALLARVHGPRDRELADRALLQWFSWLPAGVDPDVVHRRMVERGWVMERAEVASMLGSRARDRASRIAAGDPPAPERQIIVLPGSIYGQATILDGRMTVRRR